MRSFRHNHTRGEYALPGKYEKNHQEYVLDDVDTLVFAVGYNPVASPIENAHLIGDCQKVGTLKDAITNAYQITKEI